MRSAMSAFGPKRTFGAYVLESAFGGKADIEIYERCLKPRPTASSVLV
jgi:hypothetical protein